MSGNREQRIRWEAFALWNVDGCPEGNADQYWYETERIVDRIDKLTEEEEKRGDL